MRGESLAGSLVRLSFCAALSTAGFAVQRWGLHADWVCSMQWAGFAGAAWSEAERWGSRLWITNQRVVAKVGLSYSNSEMPLDQLGSFELTPAHMGASWLVAAGPKGTLRAKLLLIERAPEAIAIAEKARQAARARQGTTRLFDFGDDFR